MIQTNPVGVGANSGVASTQSLNQLGEDYTRFLTLLTAQISNQDPLSPMDSTQFVAQLAQMSQVEQAVQSNAQLEVLRHDLASMAAMTSLQLVGQEVSVASSTAVLENGGTETYFRLGAGAANVSAEIVDPLGRVIRTIENLPTDAEAEHSLGWDGLDDSGNPVLDGAYTVNLTASDEYGNPINHLLYRYTAVEEVFISFGEAVFDVGADEVVSDDAILSVR